MPPTKLSDFLDETFCEGGLRWWKKWVTHTESLNRGWLEHNLGKSQGYKGFGKFWAWGRGLPPQVGVWWFPWEELVSFYLFMGIGRGCRGKFIFPLHIQTFLPLHLYPLPSSSPPAVESSLLQAPLLKSQINRESTNNKHPNNLDSRQVSEYRSTVQPLYRVQRLDSGPFEDILVLVSPGRGLYILMFFLKG